MQAQARSTRVIGELSWGLLLVWVVVTTIGWAVYWGLNVWVPGSDPNYPGVMLSAWQDAYTRSGTNDLAALATTVSGIVGGLAFSGPILGIGQALILRTRGISRKQSAWWFVATWVGLFFGWGLGGCFTLDAILAAGNATGVQEKSTGTFPPELVVNGATVMALIISGTIIAAIVGLIVGFSQWRILRRWVRNGGWWILASLFAWAAGGAVYWAVYRIMGGTLQDANEPWPGREVYVRASLAGYVAGGIVVGVLTAVALKYLLDRGNKELFVGNKS